MRCSSQRSILTVAFCFALAAPLCATSPPAQAPDAAAKPLANVEPLVVQPAPLVGMVRALKVTQNRLAFGDEEAIKASNEETRTILSWIEIAPSEAWKDRRNIMALAVFLLGGGSIGAGRQVFDDPALNAEDRDLINGVIAYASGRFDEGTQALKKIDPLALDPILGAHISMAQATLMGEKEPKKAFEALTQSALLAPGTLIEEAALRRQIMLAAANPEIGSLGRVVEVYARRFGRSVYRRGLVEPILAAFSKREFDKKSDIDAVIAAFDPLTGEERAKILLHLAEGQLALGRLELAKVTADQAQAAAPDKSAEKARAQLYSAVSSVFTGNEGSTGVTFEGIDRAKLSAGDESLFEVTKEAIRLVKAVATVDPSGGSDAKPRPLFTKARAMMTEVDKLLHGG